MKTTLMICLTSGLKGPEVDLTAEQAQGVSDLIEQLSDPWTGPPSRSLGADHYIVVWEDDESAAFLGLRVDSSGFASVWKKSHAEWHNLTDTVGLWGYLAPIASNAYQKWIEDAQKRVAEYNEKMFGASE